MSFSFKSPSDVPVQFLPWLRPGAAYDKENILKWPNETDFGEPNTYKYRGKTLDSMAQSFEVSPKIADIAKFIKVDPELFAHFLLTSPPAVRQFFDFDRETVLLYVYYVYETLDMVHRKPGCVNDFKSGYSYLVALDSRNVAKIRNNYSIFYDYHAEKIRVVLEQKDITHPMFENCKVLLNWAPATIEQLREYVYKSQCGNLFFTLKNLENLKTEFIGLLKRVTDIENSTICSYSGSDLVKKSWALTTTLISRYPLNSHNELLNCFLNKFSSLVTIQKQVCDILKKRYQDNIKKIGAERLYNQILSWRPEKSAESNSHWTEYFIHNALPSEVDDRYTKHDQPTNSTGCQESLSKSPEQHQNKLPEKMPELPLIRQKNDLATTKIINQPAPKTVNSDVDDGRPVLPPILPPPPPQLPVPKTVIHIPSGNLAFWQKVFDGDDVVIKQDEKFTVRVTTETGQKFTVQVIQPRQFNGISNLNEKDAQFELNGDRFVCQFCTTFLSVHSKKEDIVYCRCGEFKQTDFLPGQATCKLTFSLLSKDRNLPHIKVINPPVPKTVIHIPSGSSAFWQKVFDGYDVIIKEDEKSTVRVTTKTGKQFTVQVIQPRQFNGISKGNEKDAKLELDGDRFVCQFCTTFLSVHSKKEDIVYCRCGEFKKKTDFLPGQATCSSILSLLYKDSEFLQTEVFNRPVPKTVIRIPSGYLAFWQKLFDGYDVVIKQDEKSTVRVTTETGQKFTVQAIQPYQFIGISVFNKTDAQLEKDGVRFVCQFCRTFLNVHPEKEGIVYCRCGTFKNSNFIPADHKFESRKPKIPTDEMNILLIGASGAGKSTLINNIANLVKFKTQKEAYNGELTAVIPSRFVVGKGRDTLDVETIVVGEDLPEAENEDFNDFGQSITQRPRMCSITTKINGETKKFNFIDTPGINDTRGLDQDDINIDYIKRAVLQAGYLHSICIVLLPNQSRMETDFESVLRRLLQFVPLEHRPNLVLFFTNTRGTLYRPGQTYPVLRKFAEAEPELQIPLDQDRLFCFDSESYNFLCAHHHGIEYDLTSPSQYKDSWKESRKSLYRFFEFLDTVTPFATSEIGFIDIANTLLIKCAKALMKLPNTNTQYDTVKHLIGVLASSLNGEVKKAREIAQSIGFTEDIKLQRFQQLAFFQQLTWIDGLLSDSLQEKVQKFCDLYEPHFRFNNE